MNISAWTILIIGVLVLLILAGVVRSVSAKKWKNGTGTAKGSGSDTAPPEYSGIDPKVAAIIVAAICAASGKSASGFRIAALERTGISTPVWGHIDRMARRPRGR